MKLDKWDCLMIQAAKQGSDVSVNEIKKIWSARCNMEVGHARAYYIVQHFLKIAFQINLFCNEYRFTAFITDLLKNTVRDDWDNCLYNIMIKFACASVEDLPGYAEFLASQQTTKQQNETQP